MFRDAIVSRLGSRVSIEERELPWPDRPFHDVAEVHEASGDEDALIEWLEGKSGIVTQLAPLTERVFDASPGLRFVGVSRGGPENVNIEAARRNGVAVVNVPGRNRIATAEMTIGLILAVTRRIPMTQATLAGGDWCGGFYGFERVGTELFGTPVGVVGAGAVGAHVAGVLSAMGAQVMVYDPFVRAETVPDPVRVVDDLDELFRASSVVTLHARLTRETQGLASRARIDAMPVGSYIVNSARGGLLDYDAVADAVDSGHLAGAALDVFPTEPADFTHRLFALLRSGANVVATPHIAGASRQTAARAAAGVAEELRRFISGEPPLSSLVAPARSEATR